MKTVKAKKALYINDISYSVGVGCVVRVEITPEQKWTARKSGKYWLLNRKGTGLTLRLTDAFLNNNFKIETERTDG